MTYQNHTGGKKSSRQQTQMASDKWGIPTPNGTLLPTTKPQFKVGDVVKNALRNQYIVNGLEFSPARGDWKYICASGNVETKFFGSELTLVATPAPKPAKKNEIKTLTSTDKVKLDEQIAQYLDDGWAIIWQTVETADVGKGEIYSVLYVRLHRVVETASTPEPIPAPDPAPLQTAAELTLGDNAEVVEKPEVVVAGVAEDKTLLPVGKIDPTKPVLELVATHGAEAVTDAVREHVHNMAVKAAKNTFDDLHGLHGEALAQKALEILKGDTDGGSDDRAGE